MSVPSGARYRGHEGARAYMSEARDLWELLEPVGEVFTDFGDHVLVTRSVPGPGTFQRRREQPGLRLGHRRARRLIVSHRAGETYDEALRVAGIESAEDPAA